MAKQQSREQGITLRGSAEMVAEFFSYGINSILYQRGIYPAETFTHVQKYGLTMLVTADSELKNYLNNVVGQLKEWLSECSVQRLVVVISSKETSEVLERWQFDIECDKAPNCFKEVSWQRIFEKVNHWSVLGPYHRLSAVRDEQ